VKRVLVTGASGFVGRHSLPFLVERGYEVHAVARGATPAVAGVRSHSCDLLDDRATRDLCAAVRPSHLLHFAWYAVPGRFWSALDNLDWAAASLRLLRAVAANGGSRVVVAGSCAEYDWTHAVLSPTETPLVPRTLYGTAKNAVRACLERAAGELGLGWAWGRLFFLYGPHEAPGRLVSDVIAGLLASQRVPVSAGLQRRDFMHVEDAARAFVELLDSGFVGPLNIASGDAVAVGDVVARLGALTERTDLIDFGARPTPIHDPVCLAADVRDLAERVGFAARYDLATGLSHAVDWWRTAPSRQATSRPS
jgi:nucleoside-diphosphate-sugar epimerase